MSLMLRYSSKFTPWMINVTTPNWSVPNNCDKNLQKKRKSWELYLQTRGETRHYSVSSLKQISSPSKIGERKKMKATFSKNSWLRKAFLRKISWISPFELRRTENICIGGKRKRFGLWRNNDHSAKHRTVTSKIYHFFCAYVVTVQTESSNVLCINLLTPKIH